MKLYVGRGEESAQLLQLRRKKTASLAVCQGRRRIGKSTFIRRSSESFDHFFAFEGLAPRPGLSRADQLREFARRLAEQTQLPPLTLETWPQAFQLLSNAIPRKGWTLVLLDEISWCGST